MAISGTIRCPVCAATDPLLADEVPGYRIFLCRQCRLRYSDPMRPASRTWYESCPYYADMRNARRPRAPEVLLAGDWRYRQTVRHVPPHGQRLLDVGCNVGEWVQLARQLGYDASGVDHDQRSIDRGRELYGQPNIRCCAVAELLADRPDEKYDVITLFDVLEHLQDPLQTVRELAQLLRSRGHFVANVPSWDRWPRLLSRVGDFPPHHLTLWSPEALRQTLNASGLQPEVVCRKPLHSADLLEAIRARIPWIRGQTLCKKILRRAVWKGIASPLAGLLRVSRRSGGFSLLAVGRKP